MFKLSQHGFPAARQVSLQDHPEPGGELRVNHLAPQVPEEEVPYPLVEESSLQEEASQQAIMVGLKLQGLRETMGVIADMKHQQLWIFLVSKNF